MDRNQVENLIRLCQAEAEKSIKSGDSPFGCVITDYRGTPVVRAHNEVNSKTDPTAHAEITALRRLGKKLQSRYFDGYILFANATSCSMCMTGAIKANITCFYFGAPSEPGMDPAMTGEAVAATAKKNIKIHTAILKDECLSQIIRGRKNKR